MSSEQLGELFNAMVLFRGKLVQPKKDASNPFFKKGYVTLEGVMKAVDEGIKGTGLSYSQIVANDEHGNVGVRTIIGHKSGQYFDTGLLSLTPEKKTPQGYGSAITYEKRYQLAALFGVSSDKDDDGNQATPSANPRRNYQRQGSTKPQTTAKTINQQEQATIENKGKLFAGFIKQIAEMIGTDEKSVKDGLIKEAKQDPRYANGSENEQASMLVRVAEKMRDSAKEQSKK